MHAADSYFDATTGMVPVVEQFVPIEARSDVAVAVASLDDPSVFEHLFDRHSHAVMRYAGARVGSQRAEDVASETFLIAFDKRHKVDRSAASLRPWLYGIATNVMRKMHEAETRWLRSRSAGRDEYGYANRSEGVDVDTIVRRVDAQSYGDEISEALEALSRTDREVIVLLALDDLSYAELAQAVGTRIGTVKSRVNRARRLFANALDTSRTAASAEILPKDTRNDRR